MKRSKGRLMGCPECGWGGIVMQGCAAPKCPVHGLELVRRADVSKMSAPSPIKAGKGK